MPQPARRPPRPPPGRALRARYRRIMRFAARALVQAWWFELVLPRIGLGAPRRARTHGAPAAARAALPRARRRPRRADDQGRPVPVVAPRHPAARDHPRTRGPAGRGGGRAVRRHPRADRGRARHAARARLRVVRAGADRRGIPRSGASRAPLARRSPPTSASRMSWSRCSAPASSRSSRSTSRRCAGSPRWVARIRLVYAPRRRARARRGVRRDQPRRDRLPARGRERRALRRRLRRRPARRRAGRRLGAHLAAGAHPVGRDGDQDHGCRRPRGRRHRPDGGRPGARARDVPADLRGRLLPRRPAPRQHLRDARAPEAGEPLAPHLRRLRHDGRDLATPSAPACATSSSPPSAATAAAWSPRSSASACCSRPPTPTSSSAP